MFSVSSFFVKEVIKLFSDWPWVSLESPLNIKVLSKTLRFSVLVPCSDHPVLILRLELVKLLVEDVVDLFLVRHTVPVIEVVDFLVVLVDVVTQPYVVKSVRSNLHSPNVLAMLYVDVLRKLRAWGIEFIDESQKVGCG